MSTDSPKSSSPLLDQLKQKLSKEATSSDPETPRNVAPPLEQSKKRIVLLLSGGLDSTTLLFHLRKQGHDVRCLSFHYGQRHSRETNIAEQLCSDLNIRHNRIELATLGHLLKGSSLTDTSVPVPEGEYNEHNMRKTVVPNRNMVMIAIAAAVAIAEGRDTVSYAAHGGDHTLYPDTRPEYIEALTHLLHLCDWKKVELYTPFNKLTKRDIVTIGAQLGVPFEITWSCYKGLVAHCGDCTACTERKQAFVEAGVPDPTVYGIPEEGGVANGDTEQ